ncbi:MAG TPA: ABC transporter substrate-binding protein [Kofleriaceae bacterium]|nr:ABC transporter substrate-binding protein [Kofleriaceae bacterium]
MRGGAIAFLLATATLAHGESRPRYGGTVEATLLGAPASLDPIAARTHAEVTVVGLVFDTLYRLDADGTVEPLLAEGPPVLDEKHTTVRIAIKKGIRLHDGTEMKALDVAQSLERVRVQAKWLIAPLIGVKEDGDAVVLSLRAPVPELTTLLALPQLAITKAGKAPGDHPVGSGPYMVDGLDRPHHRLQLRAFGDYFAGPPYVDQLVLAWYDTTDGEARRFETGKSQVSARGAAAFAGGQPAFRSIDIEGPPALLLFVGFGRAHADVTGDRSFRRALDLAIARGGLTSITSGERIVPTRSPVPVEAGGVAIDAASRAGDLDGARRELADAARRVASLTAAQLPKLRLEVLIEDTRPDDREIAEKVVLALDKLGIQAVITAVNATVMRDRVNRGQCDLWIGQLAEPVGIASVWVDAAFAAGNDDWPQLQPQVDPAAATKELSQRLPIVPLMFRSVRMWHPTNVRGIAFDAEGRPCYADVFVFGPPTPAKGRP